MDAKFAEIGAKSRKIVMFSFSTSYRSLCRNPFLVCVLLFLIFLYRCFPLLFSILVSVSPVLVSTAVLLGTLLSYGHPNIPEIETEVETETETEAVTDEILSLKIGTPIDSDYFVIEGDGSYPLERYTTVERDLEDKCLEDTSSVANNASETDRDESPLSTSPIRDENSRKIEFESREGGEVDEKERESNSGGKGIENHQYTLIQDSDNESETENTAEGSLDSGIVEDRSNYLSDLQLKEDVEEDEQSDSESDGDESLSPDASMADIIPMLDELHPLLDEEEATQPAHISESGSQHSSRSGKSGHGSDLDSETHEDLEAVEDEEREEESKAAITWTEDDEKNLMNLGTSELERNRRLESLIARRRSRKNMRMMAERNLIDFESTDLPFNVAPVSTSRKNPFDLPFDSHDNVPGSAPSVLNPRRNPFDLPYDSSEEKPDLVGHSLSQASVTFHHKEQGLFTRHESFNVGPSIFRQDKQDIKSRPFFVPEQRMEDPNFSFLQRQLSEMSESKASSIPETESVGSAGELENKKLIDNDDEYLHDSQETEIIGFVRVENVIKLGGEDNIQEKESHLSETGSTTNLVELNATAFDGKIVSRSSSLSDFVEKEDGLLNTEQTQVIVVDQPDIMVQHKEPIYDLSPRSSFRVEQILSVVSLDENNVGSKEVGDINDDSANQEDSSDSEEDSSDSEEDSLHKDCADSVGEVSAAQSAIEEKSIDKEVVLGYEQDQVDQSTVDDKSMNPSSDIHEELKESLIIARESADDVGPSDRFTELESTSVLSYLKGTSIHNGLANADETNPAVDHIDLQNNNEGEDEDEIKEIDEGLLSELDAVGDFSIKNVIVEHPDQENTSVALETEEIPANIEEKISKLKEEMSRIMSAENEEVEILGLERNLVTDSGLEQNLVVNLDLEQNPVLDSGLEQNLVVDSGLEQNLVVDSGLEENPVINLGLEQNLLIDSGLEKNPVVDSGLEQNPVVDSGLEQNLLIDSGLEKNPVVESGLNQNPAAKIHAIEDSVTEIENIGTVLMENEGRNVDVIPFLEAGSAADIELAFQQAVTEEENKKPVVEKSHTDLVHEETEAGNLQENRVHSDSTFSENKIELPVIESRSIESNEEKVVKSDLQEESAKSEANEAGSSSKDVDLDLHESVAKETSKDTKKEKDEIKGKKKKYSSSSSSSSSSSDSD